MSGFKVLPLTILLSLLGTGLYAQSQMDDFGIWSSIQIVKSFGKPYAMARYENRTYNNSADVECWFAMAGGGYNFTKWLKADLSYEYWTVTQDTPMHKGVLAVTGTLRREGLGLMLREKYELCYTPGTDSFTHTIRTRLRAEYRFEKVFTPYVMLEVFNVFGTSSDGWLRNLYYAGNEFRVGKCHVFDLFYMYHQYKISPGNEFGSRHILGLGYNFIF